MYECGLGKRINAYEAYRPVYRLYHKVSVNQSVEHIIIGLYIKCSTDLSYTEFII